MMVKKALKTGPHLVGQHHQKLWLNVQREHAQQRGSGGKPSGGLQRTLAWHVKHAPAVGPGLGAESALPAPAN